MSRKTKAFSKLIDYIEVVDSELFGIIEDLCLDTLFTPKRGSGLTLLLPTDKKYRANLKKLSVSDNLDDADTAANIISSLLITDILKTPGDVMEKRDDIPNALGQRIEIKGVIDRTIMLKSSVEMVVDERFRDGSRGKLAVWIVNNGGPPLDGPPASNKYTKKRKGKPGEKEEVVETTGENSSRIRIDISNRIENAYIIERSNRINMPDNYTKDVYLEAVLSLVGFMMRNEYCKELLINKVLPLISFDKTDFYLIFEPFKSIGPYLVSDKILVDWSKERKNPNFKVIIDGINKLLNEPTGVKSSSSGATSVSKALMYSNPQGALNEINEKRTKILNLRSAPQNLPSRIRKIYEELFKSEIFPQELLSFYNSPMHKMCEDEFRFVIYQMFSKLENEPTFDRRSFDHVIEIIYNYTNGPDLKPLLLREVKSQLPPHEKVAEIRTFINSTSFFFIPISFATMKEYPHDYILNKPTPHGISSIYNISEILHRRCLRLIDNAPTVNNVAKKKEVPKTSPDDMITMLKKLKEQGKLEDFMKDI